MTSCAFCRQPFGPARKRAGEHIWAAWVSRELSGHSDLPTLVHRRVPDSPQQLREYRGRRYSHKAPGICAECNNGWMSRVDEAVKPWALPLIHGRGKALHGTGQRLLSQWAIIKALAAGAGKTAAHRIADQRFYDAMYAARDGDDVPSTFEVFLARFEGSDLEVSHIHEIASTDSPLGQADTFTAVLTIKHLALHVFGRDPDGRLQFGHVSIERSVRRIAPSTGSFVFPPGPGLTDSGLELLMGVALLR